LDPRHVLFLRAPTNGGAEALGVDRALPAMASAGWQVHAAPDLGRAQELLDEYPVGVGMAPVDAADDQFRDDIAALRRSDEHVPWVALMTPDARDDADVCRFVWEAFCDYHTMPPDTDRLLTTLGHAYGMTMIAREAFAAPPVDAEEPQMVGVCAAMQAVFRSIRKVAPVDAPVLVTGESGTGKELAARAIHERSSRASGPFVAVNVAALPEALVQSELFGHEKGAFTGAQARKIGSIEASSGGSLFLDEIGDLPLPLQVNLLRFLEERTIQRVGSHREISVDTRVVAATNTDIEAAVGAGTFREDLYFRLHVLRLEMPPLRKRGEDIEVLAHYCFDKFRHEAGPRVKGFGPTALQAMVAHSWPGNVRELINRVRRATVMCEGPFIKPSDLGLSVRPLLAPIATLDEVRAAAEKQAIQDALEKTGTVSRAARALGTSRPRLYRLMAKYGVS
jgi:DNA-binding NtrC family response regulator